ncbi:MAG: hypothetical protein H7338_24170 [Candidatus Sericytochromatia bacterium]|nr:hypothetical protein [Candidatus Sericytochromatia bacterium]
MMWICLKCRPERNLFAIDEGGRNVLSRCDCTPATEEAQELTTWVRPKVHSDLNVETGGSLVLMGTAEEWMPYLVWGLRFCDDFRVMGVRAFMDVVYADRPDHRFDGAPWEEQDAAVDFESLKHPAVLIIDLATAMQNNKQFGSFLGLIQSMRWLLGRSTWVICPYEPDEVDRQFSRATGTTVNEALTGLPRLQIPVTTGNRDHSEQ